MLSTNFSSFRNHGTCILTSDNDFQCQCLYGYTGRQCEIKMNACNSNPCHHGTCYDVKNGFYYCLCSPGYTGVNCHLEINQCDSRPCLNNGVCNI